MKSLTKLRNLASFKQQKGWKLKLRKLLCKDKLTQAALVRVRNPGTTKIKAVKIKTNMKFQLKREKLNRQNEFKVLRAKIATSMKEYNKAKSSNKLGWARLESSKRRRNALRWRLNSSNNRRTKSPNFGSPSYNECNKNIKMSSLIYRKLTSAICNKLRRMRV